MLTGESTVGAVWSSLLLLCTAGVCGDPEISATMRGVSEQPFGPVVTKDRIVQDIRFMRLALDEAGFAFSKGEVPVGAVLVLSGAIISRAHNLRETLNDPSAHAEVIALKEGAARLGTWRLGSATLYVTKEPCIMCAGAMVNSRLGGVVYGCSDVKGGAVDSLYRILDDRRLNHQVEVIRGVLEGECAQILKMFFGNRR